MEYRRYWKIFLIASGILTIATILFPGLIVIGIFGAFLLAIVFFAAPPLFFYSISFTALVAMLRSFGKWRWFLASAILIVGGLATPYLLNRGTYEKLESLTAEDTEMLGSVGVRKTIAILNAPVPSRPKKQNRYHECIELCQRLLYSGAAERVLIGNIRDADRGNFAKSAVTAYYTEKRDNCPSSLETLEAVSWRIAAGECLVSEESIADEADIVYLTERIIARRNFEYYDGYDPTVVAVSARRKSILEKTDTSYRTLFRKTEIYAQPLIHPLLFSGVFRGGGGGDIVIGTGFLRRRLILNDLRNFEKDDEPRIFAEASMEAQNFRSVTREEERALIRRALHSSGLQRQAGHNLFDHYLGSFSDKREKRPDPSDVQLMILALQDHRVRRFGRIWAFTQKLDPVPDDLIVAMADRILRTPDERSVVKPLSFAIENLPAGEAAIVSSQILEMLQDEELRSLASGAVMRLGDGEPRAADHYAADIEAWYQKESERSTYTLNLPKGSLVGLCRLGKAAVSAKETLYRAFEISEKSVPPGLVLDALLSMGAEEELREKFQSHEHWGVIERSIKRRERAVRNGTKFCRG